MENLNWNFEKLLNSIQETHSKLADTAKRAVNVTLTARNWLIGSYISEYELRGTDRAIYGEKLIPQLAKKLEGVSNCNKRQLYDYVKFYKIYPEFAPTLSAQFKTHLENQALSAWNQQIVPTPSALYEKRSGKLLSEISYSMFKILVEIDNEVKRSFYEEESIKGGWSVRELKRQVDSLYFERLGLSKNKEAFKEETNRHLEKSPTNFIRDPYVFEFLGLTPNEVMSESHLEEQLLTKIEGFLLELGHGFCFEARQKRILIGDEHFFIDLVFYNRILKCHVLVELKLEKFTHENIGQLNTYVSWYKKNVMVKGDNPPVGILLCTDKNHALAEYALAGMDNNLFVSKYLLELPEKEKIQKFIEQEIQLGVINR